MKKRLFLKLGFLCLVFIVSFAVFLGSNTNNFNAVPEMSVHTVEKREVPLDTSSSLDVPTECVVQRETETQVPTQTVTQAPTQAVTESLVSSATEAVMEFTDISEPIFVDEPSVSIPDFSSWVFDNTIERSSVPDYTEWSEIAYFSCPAVSLYEIPIWYGFSQEVCDACEICLEPWSMDGRDNHLFGDNQLLTHICGHNYKALSVLHEMSQGDDIYIRTIYGGNYHYKVDFSCLLTQDQDSEYFYGYYDSNGNYPVRPWENTSDMVISTCYDMGINGFRWVVRAYLVEGSRFV